MANNIKVGNILSQQVRQHIGLRQGDTLSPNLFKLFLNDLSKCFDASDDQGELGNINFSCLMYADDLVLLSTSETGLQSCLNKLSFLCVSHGLTVNLKKTNIRIFSKSGRKSIFLFNDVEQKEIHMNI